MSGLACPTLSPQILFGDLTGEFEEGKHGSLEARFGSSEVANISRCRSLIFRLTISKKIQFI